jgi:phosphatidylserine/phosphatidylglycerophosphate/cardiolipin synthase-like enzyme
MRRCVTLGLIFVSISATLFAAPPGEDDLRKVNYPFEFKLYTADISCWRSGECHGEIPANSKGPLAQGVEQLILTSRTSVDMAIYGLRRQSWFVDALSQLKKRNVVMRATVDQMAGELNDWSNPANFPYPDSDQLVEVLGADGVRPDVSPAGNPRVGTIMHNKFIVVDRKSVWMGSANISDSETGSNYNANSAIIINSKDIARIYSDEFKQMFVDRRYSLAKHSRSSRSPIEFSDKTKASIYFSPQDNPLEEAILPFIRASKKSLAIGMFFLTEPRISEELALAKARGVDVRVLMDAVGARNRASRHNELRERGVQVRVENWGGKMHMKTAVSDGKNVLMGSMNWSEAGNRVNDENTITIENNSKLATQLEAYFDDLWEPLDPSQQIPPYRLDPNPESKDSINSCYDGVNNDYDPFLDLEEKVCQ